MDQRQYPLTSGMISRAIEASPSHVRRIARNSPTMFTAGFVQAWALEPPRREPKDSEAEWIAYSTGHRLGRTWRQQVPA